MTARIWKSVLLAGLSASLGAVGGYWLGHRQDMGGALGGTPAGPGHRPDERQVLYWYDPMYPQQKFDKPGKSPFMDMDLVPRYADAGEEESVVSIDPRATQNLGLRLARVTRGSFSSSLEAVGVLTLNERDIAVIQARSAGFVERVYARAPGDVLKAGAPLADLLVPEWAAAQEEFLALRRSGDAGLLAAARQRLRLAGMPAALIGRVERSGRPQAVLTISTPLGGVLQELNVRAGMAVAAGDTLARVNGLDRVWLAVAVPEGETGGIAVGQPAEARLSAFPGETLEGTVAAILPETDPNSRTLRVRVELPNPDGRLRPGMTAQVRLTRPGGQDALWVPSEAVIRTGRRTLVMRAEEAGRYRPVEVRLGRESDGKTQVLQGLEEGQQVVASGQFLLDSEASLRGIVASAPDTPTSGPVPVLHEAEGRVVAIDENGVTLAHGPFRTLGMPGMTMTFPVASAALLQDVQVGDKVRVAASQSDEGLRIERLEKIGDQP